MQVRKSYTSTNRNIRAAEYTQAANECLAKGFKELAHVNAQMAALERGDDPSLIAKL